MIILVIVAIAVILVVCAVVAKRHRYDFDFFFHTLTEMSRNMLGTASPPPFLACTAINSLIQFSHIFLVEKKNKKINGE